MPSLGYLPLADWKSMIESRRAAAMEKLKQYPESKVAPRMLRQVEEMESRMKALSVDYDPQKATQ